MASSPARAALRSTRVRPTVGHVTGREPRTQPGRHVVHTDQMCASAAVPGSPGIAAADTEPVATTAHGVYAPVPWPIAVAYEPAGGRAPPSLAGLQLLRI